MTIRRALALISLATTPILMSAASAASDLPTDASNANKPDKTPTTVNIDSTITDTWMLGLRAGRWFLDSAEGNTIAGKAGSVSIGKSWIAHRWLAAAMFDLHMGPYEPIRDGQLDHDTSGMGATLSLSRTVRGLATRQEGYSWGWTSALSWAEMATTSIGKNRVETSDPTIDEQRTLYDNYKMKSTTITAGGGLFWAFLAPTPRVGNMPSQLITRVEGVIVRLIGLAPVYSTYKSTYDLRGATRDSRADRGSLHGYAVTLSVDTLFGG